MPRTDQRLRRGHPLLRGNCDEIDASYAGGGDWSVDAP
jgi:hypothetical protein